MNVPFLRSISAAFAAIALSLAGVAAHAQSNSIAVALSSDSANLSGTDDVTVNVTLTNLTAETVYVPKWYVPLEGTAAGVFTVLRDGEAVPYLGAIVKRRAPTAKDFVRIAPRGSLELTVELSSLYDLSATGVYTVQYDVKSVQTFRGRTLDATTSERTAAQASEQSQDLMSNAIALTIAGSSATGARRALANDDAVRAAAPAFAASVSFVGCSNTRSTQVRTALSSAETYASNSLGYLNAGTRGPRYTTWFGTYNANRYSTVRSHFSSISNAASTKPLVFDCSTCPGTEYADAYAYVYSNQPYRVYLCNAFWAAPNTGTDSRAGTIIHELSHFTVVAGTNDYAYGQSAAKRLARTNPSRAVRNADNHEYFAENTPAQN
jgi:peptidyl-Lys metalloendopeptidase